MYGTGSHSEMQVSEYAAQLKQSLEDAYRLVCAKLAVSHERWQVQYTKEFMANPSKKATWSGNTLQLYLKDSQRSCTTLGLDP